MEVVLASSSVDGGISCWDLRTGAVQLLHKSCASSPHGLACIGQRLIASSQLSQRSATFGTIFYWSWDKPQVEVKSFPAEPIKPLTANSEGTYLLGGGASGEIYLWEVATGKLLKHWRAHLRAVTCMVLSDDDSILVSGAENGDVRVWSLYEIFEDTLRQEAKHLYMYDFKEHTQRITDVVIGYGGYNAIFVTASEDRTCKVWSLSKGMLLRSIVFPSVINAIALDPGEHVFYAGSGDGEIYIVALHAESRSSGAYGMHIIGALSVNSKAITSLAYSTEQNLLICGSEDGTVQACDTQGHIVRTFKHTTAHVNNVAVVRKHQLIPQSQHSYKKKWFPPPLEKYADSTDDDTDIKAVCNLRDIPGESYELSYISSSVTNQQLKELEQQGSSTAKEAELERLKLDCEKSMQYNLKWKQMFENLHEFCVNEIVDTDRATRAKANIT
ncbi:protein ROOT INITIATION DEFECTIVE 3 [Punica granatum]|uniref:Uncharacterized protein n=2 Tax=Punica granatum TaxID=22663 RepID=A0A2I0IVJ3_PUNGR|nr:protein ROOT INITIATION DEFECTIVE 3 [Punica granatum]PKI48028.1 hypothetical protein CRG98_031545 [Punica granatum]